MTQLHLTFARCFVVNIAGYLDLYLSTVHGRSVFLHEMFEVYDKKDIKTTDNDSFIDSFIH